MERHRQQTAGGQVRIAIQRLAGKYPFHAKTLEQFEIRVRTNIDTMGVTVVGNRVLLLHNPEFVLSLPMDQLTGVLLHEVHHVVLGHVLADPDKYPDKWARTVAEELSANEFIKEPLPEGVITLKQFPKLPPMESTDRRYERLETRVRRFRIRGPSRLMSEERGQRKESSVKKAKPKQAGVIVDEHSVWGEAHVDRDGAKATIQTVLHDAMIEVGSAQVPEDLRGALWSQGIGRYPGTWEEELGSGGRGSLDWVRLLRRYVGHELTVLPDFTRPARRFPELVGMVPGRRRRGGRPTVLAAIDASASITPELLELISSELAWLRDRKLSSFLIGGRRHVKREDLERFLRPPNNPSDPVVTHRSRERERRMLDVDGKLDRAGL